MSMDHYKRVGSHTSSFSVCRLNHSAIHISRYQMYAMPSIELLPSLLSTLLHPSKDLLLHLRKGSERWILSQSLGTCALLYIEFSTQIHFTISEVTTRIANVMYYRYQITLGNWTLFLQYTALLPPHLKLFDQSMMWSRSSFQQPMIMMSRCVRENLILILNFHLRVCKEHLLTNTL